MDKADSFHFIFQDKLISYTEEDCCSSLCALIYRALIYLNLKENVSSELIFEKSDGEKIQFIPDDFFIRQHGSDLIIVQYGINLATIPPNEISTPYKIYFQAFSKLKKYISNDLLV